jgi:hypothetical protein
LVCALAVVFLGLAAAIPVRADDPSTLVPALGWDSKKQGGFPVALAADSAGNVWVGTEGNGLWKYDASRKAWTRFTTKDGLGDDCIYALAFDGKGRLWAGHLNHGVSVYNGAHWKNYGLLDGPIGDRVFAIAVSPKDGDIWMATDMGLARYSDARQDWDYYTRASGLPSDQVQAIVFDDNGKLYAGTQCSGIAIAGPDDDYKKWQTVTTGPAQPTFLNSAFGEGLPTDMINGLNIIRPDGSPSMVAASTPCGAAVTPDGNQWWFLRGQDWQEHTPAPHGAGNDPMGAVPPAEDWITSLATEGVHVCAGYRMAGVECRDLNGGGTRTYLDNVAKPNTAIIRAILAQPDQPPLFAAYDGAAGGLLTVPDAPAYKPATTGAAPAATPPALPAPAPVPTLADAKALGMRLGKLTQQLAPGEAYFLADDWRTQGDWIGRYGGGYTKLCGMVQGDENYDLQPGYQVRLEVGPHHDANEAGPLWRHDNENSDALRSLYDPAAGHRHDASEDDLSDDPKVYPESYDGPDLWVRVKVPDGVQVLTLFFMNDDAHEPGDAKYRDYDIQVFPAGDDLAKLQATTPLARARVTDFWGGVYKQFMICGPAAYAVRVGRNRSFGTRLGAIFLDRVTGDPPDNPGHLPGFDIAPYDMPDQPDDYHPTPLADAAVNLWGQLDDALALRGAVPLEMPLHIWAYRAAVAGQAPAAILERFRWEISIWTPDDRKKFDDAVKAAHDAIK